MINCTKTRLGKTISGYSNDYVGFSNKNDFLDSTYTRCLAIKNSKGTSYFPATTGSFPSTWFNYIEDTGIRVRYSGSTYKIGYVAYPKITFTVTKTVVALGTSYITISNIRLTQGISVDTPLKIRFSFRDVNGNEKLSYIEATINAQSTTASNVTRTGLATDVSLVTQLYAFVSDSNGVQVSSTFVNIRVDGETTIYFSTIEVSVRA